MLLSKPISQVCRDSHCFVFESFRCHFDVVSMSFSHDFSCVFVSFGVFPCVFVVFFLCVFVSWTMSYRLATRRSLSQSRITVQLAGCFLHATAAAAAAAARARHNALTCSNNTYVPLRNSQLRVNWKSLRMASMELSFWAREDFRARISLSLRIMLLSSEVSKTRCHQSVQLEGWYVDTYPWYSIFRLANRSLSSSYSSYNVSTGFASMRACGLPQRLFCRPSSCCSPWQAGDCCASRRRSPS